MPQMWTLTAAVSRGVPSDLFTLLFFLKKALWIRPSAPALVLQWEMEDRTDTSFSQTKWFHETQLINIVQHLLSLLYTSLWKKNAQQIVHLLWTIATVPLAL